MSNIPKIRFKGFTEEWEQRKLGDISDIKTGPFGSTLHADDYVSDGTPIITTEHFKTGTLPQSKNGLPQVSDADYKRLTAYTLADGDIVFSRVGSVDINALITPFQSNWLFSGRVLRVRPQTDILSQFLHTRLETESIKTDIRARAVGQTMPSINTEILKITTLALPTLAAEQEQIGSYFATIDHLITLHQRKYDEITELKKYMLKKMFPAKGKNTPEIRFTGFTEDWEQRKFSDIAARESSIYTSSSDIPSVEYEDVVAEEGRLNKDVRSKEAVKSGIIFDGSQVLYGKLRPYLHNWLNPDFKGIAVGDWWVLKPINTDKNFLYRLIQTQQFDNIANQSSGSKMPRADWNLISDSEFMISLSKEEQSKIGDYFNSLDHLITLHQQKLDELTELKKYMLQNMFPKKEG